MEDLEISIDYGLEVDEVFVDNAKAIIRTDLMVLAVKPGPRSNKWKLPSWVCD